MNAIVTRKIAAADPLERKFAMPGYSGELHAIMTARMMDQRIGVTTIDWFNDSSCTTKVASLVIPNSSEKLLRGIGAVTLKKVAATLLLAADELDRLYKTLSSHKDTNEAQDHP